MLVHSWQGFNPHQDFDGKVQLLFLLNLIVRSKRNKGDGMVSITLNDIVAYSVINSIYSFM